MTSEAMLAFVLLAERVRKAQVAYQNEPYRSPAKDNMLKLAKSLERQLDLHTQILKDKLLAESKKKQP